jgi:hypothetical protein
VDKGVRPDRPRAVTGKQAAEESIDGEGFMSEVNPGFMCSQI